MISSIDCIVEPAKTPVSLDEVKTRLRIDHSDEDSLLELYLKSSTHYAQEHQWSQLVTATFVERFDCFPCEIRPKKCPLLSVTSLAYVDTAGNTQTLVANTDYTVDIYKKPGRIIPAYRKSWPATRGFINDVTLTYIAGYGEPSDVPHEIKAAIILKTEEQLRGCEDGGKLAKAVDSLLDLRSFRVFF